MTKTNTTPTGASKSELEAAAIVEAHEGKVAEGNVPTNDSIAMAIHSAMDAAFSAFNETELRRVGDNGKLYKINKDLPTDVEDTGNLQTVRVWRYVQDQITSVLCWKLEDLLYRCDEQINDQRKQIRAAMYQLENGRVEPSFIDAKADYLETLLVQHTMLASAFAASRDAHFNLIGTEYETRQSRVARRAVEAKTKTSPMHDRLKALGVS